MSSRNAIQGIAPALVWERFYEISQIPRPSKKEEQITAHFEQLFQKLGVPYEKDSVGNLVARVPATKGYEKAPIVVLQGHSDMVCEKNRDTEHDFDKDPIHLVRNGEWIGAKGTTLGADNGIGVAAALALLSDKDAEHGPLEILITIDEETGLTGANKISSKLLKGKYLINLDSEEDGIFYIGCAGGIDTTGTFRVKHAPLPAGKFSAFSLRISGLKGGHSGGDIHLGRANAIKLLARTLEALQPLSPFFTAIQGGSKRNAIPREAELTLVVPELAADQARTIIAQCEQNFKNEFKANDPGVKLVLEPSTMPMFVYAKSLATKLLQTLLALPHGVIQMSADIEGLVETSTNLATVVSDESLITIGTNQRSSVESAKRYIAGSVSAAFGLAGAHVEQTDGYPGWQPNMDSKLLQICRKVGKAEFGKEPEIKAIHAGLECGILGGKYPGLDMISFGPTITGAHSPDERVHIPAVEKFYDLLKAVLIEIAKA
ncbi:MAG: aminoacyl-histidine dipeptidase [Lewinellaceae bacterium]|nr:aminoacyl-histidine dipeptidase [Saprospiraceae bacterium]MCB9334049.1 aminoacyl-histidine dipeptidase [Lewinellaceae bacterium]